MRSRKEIESDGKRIDVLSLEVLLDIRELIVHEKNTVVHKEVPIIQDQTGKKKRGRPKKIK